MVESSGNVSSRVYDDWLILMSYVWQLKIATASIAKSIDKSKGTGFSKERRMSATKLLI